MPPSGPVKMQPLFKIHPVLIQLGSDLQRLAASSLTLLYETLLKSHSLFCFCSSDFFFFSVFKLYESEEDDSLICVCKL